MAKSLNKFEAEQSELVKQLEAQLTEKDRVLADYKKGHGNLELFFNSVLASIEAMKPLPILYKESEHRSTPIIAVMQIADAHMGAVQEASEIEGFNEFNPEICRSRQISFAQRFNKWVSRTRKSYTVDECAVLVTGDLISGDIHQELLVTNAFPSTVQVVKAAQVLAEQMTLLAQNFKVINVHFIAADNHGRLTKKPQAKQEGLNNLNYLVGILAQTYLEKIKNVNFNIYAQHEKVVSVGNRNYLLSHGHAMKSWLGIPWYAAERKVGKETQARMQLVMDQKLQMHEAGFHKFVFSHFHTPVDTTMYSCCGSVQGTDAYDHVAGRYAVPSQAAWFVHPKYKEMSRENFEL